jgi:hypothetical protein
MLFPTKKIFEEYKHIVVKMNDDFHGILTTNPTVELLCDVEVAWASFALCLCWK